MKKISFGVPKIPKLKKGDDPFQPSPNPRSEARLDMAHRSFVSYAIAYKEAGNRLVACALRRRDVYPDLAVVPVMFLYRHYLGLTLKEIICSGQRCSLKEAKLDQEHDLSKLWEGTRSVVKELWPEQDESELATVGDCILRFHQVDERSQAFRYPTDRKGRQTLQSLARVDVQNLKRVMAGVAAFLDGCIDGIDYLNSNCP